MRIVPRPCGVPRPWAQLAPYSTSNGFPSGPMPKFSWWSRPPISFLNSTMMKSSIEEFVRVCCSCCQRADLPSTRRELTAMVIPVIPAPLCANLLAGMAPFSGSVSAYRIATLVFWQVLAWRRVCPSVGTATAEAPGSATRRGWSPTRGATTRAFLISRDRVRYILSVIERRLVTRTLRGH